MIATLTILENGSYSPNANFLFGNKFDNLVDNYLIFKIPPRYRNYHYYVYGHCEQANIFLPCNYVDGELRFYVTNSITKTPGVWEMVFIASQNAVDINTDLNINHVLFGPQRFISNAFYGTVNDNDLTNPPLTDVEDENLIIYYDRLNKLDDDLREAWASGDLDGPYYKPSVDKDSAIISWTSTRADMPSIPSVNIRGPKGEQGEQGIQGPYYVPTIEDGVLGFEGSQIDMPTSDLPTYNFNDAIESEVKNVMDWRWDATNQTLYFYTPDYTGDKYGDS